MVHWIFALITLIAVSIATIVQDIRRAIFAFWVAGLAVGAIYLSLGAEFLAIFQWLTSTLVTTSLLFFAVLFGENGKLPKEKFQYSIARRSSYSKLLVGFAIILGISFASLVWLGVSGLSLPVSLPAGENDLVGLGKKLSGDHFISLQVLTLTLFLVLIGAGIIARPEKRHQGDEI